MNAILKEVRFPRRGFAPAFQNCPYRSTSAVPPLIFAFLATATPSVAQEADSVDAFGRCVLRQMEEAE